jgi:hypothetical protein
MGHPRRRTARDGGALATRRGRATAPTHRLWARPLAKRSDLAHGYPYALGAEAWRLAGADDFAATSHQGARMQMSVRLVELRG